MQILNFAEMQFLRNEIRCEKKKKECEKRSYTFDVQSAYIFRGDRKTRDPQPEV